jgi:hypothetical protein
VVGDELGTRAIRVPISLISGWNSISVHGRMAAFVGKKPKKFKKIIYLIFKKIAFTFLIYPIQ